MESGPGRDGRQGEDLVEAMRKERRLMSVCESANDKVIKETWRAGAGVERRGQERVESRDCRRRLS
jgi:hypothetical protein